MTYVDKTYKEIMNSILADGVSKNTRSGDVISVFGRTARFNLRDGLPVLTIKKVFLRGIIEELLWFISGETNIKPLLEKGINIWNDDAERYFHEKLERHNQIAQKFGMKHHLKEKPTHDRFLEMVLEGKYIYFFEEKYYTDGDNNAKTRYTFGDLGPVYGKNWRKFGINSIDQVKKLITKLKTDPNDRRLLITGYNPDDVETAALPPCHLLYQFYTKPMLNSERFDWLLNHSNGQYDEWKCPTSEMLDSLNVPKLKLSCMLYCRSQDFLLGTVFNWASASLLTYMIAEVCNMDVDELIWTGGDVHIYENQMAAVDELNARQGTNSLPRLRFARKIDNIDNFRYDDFIIEGYKSDPVLKIPLSTGKGQD